MPILSTLFTSIPALEKVPSFRPYETLFILMFSYPICHSCVLSKVIRRPCFLPFLHRLGKDNAWISLSLKLLIPYTSIIITSWTPAAALSSHLPTVHVQCFCLGLFYTFFVDYELQYPINVQSMSIYH